MRVLLRAPLDQAGWRALARALASEGVDVRVAHVGSGDVAHAPDGERAWLAAHADDRAPARVIDPDTLRERDVPVPLPSPAGVGEDRVAPPGTVAVVAPLRAPGRAARVASAWVQAGPPRAGCLVLAVVDASVDAEAEVRRAVPDTDTLGNVVLIAEPPCDGGHGLVRGADVLLGDDDPLADIARACGVPVLEVGEGLARGLEEVVGDPWAREIRTETARREAARRSPAAVARRIVTSMPALRVIRAPAAGRDRPLVAIVGDVTVATSLGALNRGLARGLLDRGDVDVALVPDADGPLTADPEVSDLLSRAPLPARPPDVTVRNGHPPRFDRAASGAQVHWVHWEFGPPPRAWQEACLLAADEVWVDSPFVRAGMVEAGLPAARVAVVPPGVDPDRLRPGAPPVDLGDAAPGFRFLFVGGLAERKGADLLLEAYARAFGPDDDVTLVVKRFGAGGPYARTDSDARAEAMAADPRGPRVRVAEGPLTDAAVAGLYAACDCLVHPYRGEAFGMTMLEAMACGLPVIAPDRGAARAFMDDDTAVLVPSTRRVLPMLSDAEGRSLTGPPVVHEVDVADLADAMRRVATDPAVRAVGARAAARVHAGCTWRHTAEIAAQRITALCGRYTEDMRSEVAG